MRAQIEKRSAEVVIIPEDDFCRIDLTCTIEKDPDFGRFANDVVNHILKKQGYKWVSPLNLKRVRPKVDLMRGTNPWIIPLGLGYTPVKDEISKIIRARSTRKGTKDINLAPYAKNLSNYLVEGGKIDPLKTLIENFINLF